MEAFCYRDRQMVKYYMEWYEIFILLYSLK